MKNIFLILVLPAALFLLLSGCKKDEPAAADETPASVLPPLLEDETPPPLEVYEITPGNFPRMDGCPSAIPLAQALASVMLGGTREEADGRAMFTGSAQAFRSLAAGMSDLIIAGEPPPSVTDEISRQDFRYDMAPVAMDALVFIVSKSNPVNNLTSAQVKAIYAGEITGWQSIGGDELDIIAFQRNEEATSRILTEMLVMDWAKMADAPMQPLTSLYSIFLDDPAATAIKGFDSSVNAIGYTMYYYAVNMAMAGRYKILSIDGILPTPDTIASGAYPFVNPYYAVINKELPEDDSARVLYNWLLSDEGQALIASEGYVSMKDSAAAGGITPSAPPQMRWNVKADVSGPAPYDTPRSNFSELYNAALPGLEPYDGYGLLLPYSTAVTMNDGSIHAVKHGFVTERGIVVTDPVYDGISRAVYTPLSGNTSGTALPAYRLFINLPEDDFAYRYRTVQAACAADGSWITPFSYENVVFSESVIFLMRSYDTFDIDVYDYSGNLLYNILDLVWADRISDNIWPEYLTYGESEGYAFIELDDGSYALMDVLSGTIRETDFTAAISFSEGLACVIPGDSNGLWGFVNNDLEVVLPAGYIFEAAFTGGRAIVETPSDTGVSQHIIDKSGRILYSAGLGHIITALDGYGYAIYSLASNERTFPKFLTYGFDEIDYPPGALPLGADSSVYYLGGGRCCVITDSGTWIFSADDAYALPPSVSNVSYFVEGLVVYNEYYTDDDGNPKTRTGIALPDGTIVADPLDGFHITPVPAQGSAPVFIVNTLLDNRFDDYYDSSFSAVIYKLLDHRGFEIKSDLGILSFDEASGYLYAQGSDYFSWMTPDGDIFISIPSMAYSFD